MEREWKGEAGYQFATEATGRIMAGDEGKPHHGGTGILDGPWRIAGDVLSLAWQGDGTGVLVGRPRLAVCLYHANGSHFSSCPD